MSRFLHQAVSSLTMVGYLLVITWGPLWHDHHHGHCHPHAAEALCPADVAIGHSHPHCCSHHHEPVCCEEPKEPIADGCPRSPSPCHDDDCPVCQSLAHPPLASPAIQLVDVCEPVQGFVSPVAPAVERLQPGIYDSRGPPLV